jgi:hypothetical protein
VRGFFVNTHGEDMADEETPARVEEVRRALGRLLELLAREVVLDLLREAAPCPDPAPGTENPSESSGASPPAGPGR